MAGLKDGHRGEAWGQQLSLGTVLALFASLAALLNNGDVGLTSYAAWNSIVNLFDNQNYILGCTVTLMCTNPNKKDKTKEEKCIICIFQM